LIVTGLIPWIISLADSTDDFKSLLVVHIYWVAILFFLVGAIQLLKGKSSGYVYACAASTFWLSARATTIFFYGWYGDRHSMSLVQEALGLRWPPNVNSAFILAMNTLCILGLVFMHQKDFREALGIKPRQLVVAIGVGIGMAVYGLVMIEIKDILFPPEFMYFQF
jgi:hypothetical protein